MRRCWGMFVLALMVAAVAGCAATAPPGPSQTASVPAASATAPRSATASPADATTEPTSPAGPSLSSNAPATDPVPTGAPTLAPGGRLAIRYSGTPGTQFDGLATAMFDDGAVVSVPSAGVLQADAFTRTMEEATVALRVTGTILSARGTYRVEILGGRLEEGVFVEDQVLAVSEATGGGSELRVEYGNVEV